MSVAYRSEGKRGEAMKRKNPKPLNAAKFNEREREIFKMGMRYAYDSVLRNDSLWRIRKHLHETSQDFCARVDIARSLARKG
jgi:hypothetical protein